MTDQLALDLERGMHNADASWLDAAERICLRLGQDPAGFITDDVWHELERIDDPPTTHDGRALGGIITALYRSGRIVKTGTYRRSARRRADTPVWRTVPETEANR